LSRIAKGVVYWALKFILAKEIYLREGEEFLNMCSMILASEMPEIM
jgi:hypothetical protein